MGQKEHKKLLVLGVGNLLLTDDGLGVIAAQKLMEESWPSSVYVCEAGTFTHDIFYLFGEYSDILVLDVVHMGAEAGEIYRLSEADLLDNETQRLSIHDIDLLDSLRMARTYFEKSLRLHVLGMEPKDILTWNIGLSPACETALPEFLALAREEIVRIVASWVHQE